MSLDDTLVALQRLERSLAAFDDALRASTRELSAIEDRMDGVWDDAFRREFQRRTSEVKDPVDRYINRDGERYLAFLRSRVDRLRRYLGHV
jgi:hypothetical protein